MLKRYHRFFGSLLRLFDAVVIGGAWLVAYGVRFHLPILQVKKGFPAFSTYASLLPLVMVLWIVVFSAVGVYQQGKLLRRTDEAFLVLRAHAIALGVLMAITYLFSEYRYSRAVMIAFGLIGAISLVYVRILFRNTLRMIRRSGFKSRRILGVGIEETLSGIDDRFERFPELGSRIQGILTPEHEVGDTILKGKRILGRPDDLYRILKAQPFDEVLFALPRDSRFTVEELLAKISDEPVDVRIIPDLRNYVALGCGVENFDGVPVIHLNGSPLEGWWPFWKRATDLLLSSAALLILFPVFALLAIGVRLSSRGPIFHKQERMGLDGRLFQMVKFRSMRADAEAGGKPGWTQANDPRRTRFGAFIRASSLDELPQLWNVLKGEMSLVGPRPERPEFVQQFRGEIPHYMLRHKTKAGITGWAQIHGWRGDTSLHKRIEYDLHYIRNWSYVLDWKILMLTLWRLHRNAY